LDDTDGHDHIYDGALDDRRGLNVIRKNKKDPFFAGQINFFKYQLNWLIA